MQQLVGYSCTCGFLCVHVHVCFVCIYVWVGVYDCVYVYICTRYDRLLFWRVYVRRVCTFLCVLAHSCV